MAPLWAGCPSSEPAKDSDDDPRPAAQGSADPAAGATAPEEERAGPTGTIRGFVVLASGVALPRLDPPEHAFPDGCPPYRADRDAYPVAMVGDRRLTGMLVTVTDYESRVPASPQVRTLTIEDCRLTPRLLSGSRGDTLELTNASARPFWPSVEGDALTQALLPEQTRNLVLDRGGFRKVRCGFDEPCGLAWVVTVYHPLHTVTDAEGGFRIDRVPAGEEVTVTAYHPLLGRPAEATVTVGEGQTERIELVVTPAPAPASGKDSDDEGMAPGQGDPAAGSGASG